MSIARAYESMFLRPGGPHEKYYGWSLDSEAPGLRVLRRRHGVVTRSLILLSRAGMPMLPQVVRRSSSRWGTSDIFIHDFDGALADAPAIAGLPFRRAADSERLLNIATFVIDLAQDDHALLAGMSADYRRKIRKAEQAGIQVETCVRPGAGVLARFAAAYAAFAASRNLPAFDAGTLARMYDAGDALLLVAARDGEPTNYLHLYTAGDTGLFMYGVNPAKENDGAGQYLHWQAMRELRARGFGWYDLGGVARQDRSDGIFNFKEKFGGALVPLGTEWRHMGPVLKPLVAASTLRRRFPRERA